MYFKCCLIFIIGKKEEVLCSKVRYQTWQKILIGDLATQICMCETMACYTAKNQYRKLEYK
jgi:hypothetical protein